MPIIYDPKHDDTYYLCNRHNIEDCEECSPLFCRVCSEVINEDNPESENVPGMCRECYRKEEAEDEKEFARAVRLRREENPEIDSYEEMQIERHGR